MENDSPVVAIKCMTYNHEAYISQCLDGFIMQKTDFPFIAIVHDDASTDKTASIILEYAKKYPNIIKPIFETENQYSKHDGSLTRIFDSALPAGVKYIAICEGDDYWTDPYKLQKQVTFLEQHPDYGLVYGKVRTWIQEDSRFDGSFGRRVRTFEELVKKNTIPTLTVVLKYDLDIKYRKEINPITKKWKMGDYPRWLYLSKISKIGFIDEYLGVYRVSRVSASHFIDKEGCLDYKINTLEIALYMCRKFGVDTRLTEIRLLWCKLEYAYLVSDVEMLNEVQSDIASANIWPISLRVIILKLLYRYPMVYLESKRILKKILRVS